MYHVSYIMHHVHQSMLFFALKEEKRHVSTQYPNDNYPQNPGLPNNQGQNPQYPPGYGQPYPPTQYEQPGSYPPPPQYQQPGYSAYTVPATSPDKGMGFAIAGLVLGIIAIISSWYPVCGLPIPIVGIVMSALGRRSVSYRTMATVGLVLSIIAIAISILTTAFVIIALIVSSTHP